ncbi:MAG: DUF5683 domain-containing protein [Bacteroidales bacterium]|nr:DUF5683 domain-containing protein [Bacteroidales bacterium]MDD4669651.1 DUF5683 domain-containing protein [Bacteroidales bacterium]
MRRLIITLLLISAICFSADAQFRKSVTGTNNTGIVNAPPGANTDTTGKVNPDSSVSADTTSGVSLRKLVRGFARKDTLTPGYMLMGSIIAPGIGQIYNKDYWKLPVVYGGIGAGIYYGIHNNIKYQETGLQKYADYRTIGYIGAGLVYWGSLLDGIVSFKTPLRKPVPSKSTVYSALLPGLGQAYNGDYWKIPIWYGGFIACGYFYHLNDIQYKRFKYIYDKGNDPNSGYYGKITASQAEWYKDTYRRYRDYSVLAFVLVYALNIIDANVFAYMSDFDVSDNLATVSIQPAIISPLDVKFASINNSYPAFGMQMQLNF